MTHFSTLTEKKADIFKQLNNIHQSWLRTIIVSLQIKITAFREQSIRLGATMPQTDIQIRIHRQRLQSSAFLLLWGKITRTYVKKILSFIKSKIARNGSCDVIDNTVSASPFIFRSLADTLPCV